MEQVELINVLITLLGAVTVMGIGVLCWLFRWVITSLQALTDSTDTLTRSQSILLTQHQHFGEKHNSHEMTLGEHSKALTEHAILLGRFREQIRQLQEQQMGAKTQ